MENYLTQLVASIVAAVASIAAAAITHIRANRAHRESLSVDRGRLIQEGYQDILDQLRLELERRKKSESSLRERLLKVETELEHEIELRKTLQDKVQELLKEVEQLKGDYNGE